MFSRTLTSSMGGFHFRISTPRKSDQGWIATLTIESPEDGTRELVCYGADALDTLLYGVKLASVNVAAFKREGFDLRWLNDEDCGFDYSVSI